MNSREQVPTFGLEIDHPIAWCAGSCTWCKLSQLVSSPAQADTHIVESFTFMQSLAIAQTLSTFSEPLDLSFSTCITHYHPKFQLPDFNWRPVSELSLYLNTPEYDPDQVLQSVRMFLQKYPTPILHFSFFRGANNAELQKEALAKMVPWFIALLKDSKAQCINLNFGCNDLANPIQDYKFIELSSVLDYVFLWVESLFVEKNRFEETVKALDADCSQAVLTMDESTSYGQQRVIAQALLSSEQKKMLFVNLSVLSADPESVTPSQALTRLASVKTPQVHLGKKEVFTQHDASHTQVPWAHVSYAKYLEMLARFRQGEPWAQLVCEPIHAKMA